MTKDELIAKILEKREDNLALLFARISALLQSYCHDKEIDRAIGLLLTFYE